MAEKTKGQIAEEKEKAREYALKNLKADSFRDTLGLNTIRKRRGDFGDLLYNAGEARSYGLISSKEGVETRDNFYKEKKEHADRTGYAGPVDVSNADVAYKMYEIARQSLGIVSLGKLEELVLGNGAKLEFKVPDELKDMTYNEVIESAHKKGAITEDGLDASKLEENEKDALALSQELGKAYELAAAMNFSQHVDLYKDINRAGKEIIEKYSKKGN